MFHVGDNFSLFSLPKSGFISVVLVLVKTEMCPLGCTFISTRSLSRTKLSCLAYDEHNGMELHKQIYLFVFMCVFMLLVVEVCTASPNFLCWNGCVKLQEACSNKMYERKAVW